MKIAAILVIMMITIMNAGVFAAESVRLDTDQAIYTQTQEHEAATAVITPLNEYGNMALEPLQAIKDTTNEFVNPQMEFTYEARPESADFTAEGPKFKLQF